MGRFAEARHVIVADLGFGDAGKGTIVDWLAGCAAATARQARTAAVLRFNGGAQAAHTVVRADRRSHTFAQFGAGTFAGVPTLLTRHTLVEPLALAREAAALAALGVPDPLGLISVDRDALITTPLHAAVNRAREAARGGAAHGSCGIGIGETMSYALGHPDLALRAGDTESPSRLRRRLLALHDWATATIQSLRNAEPPATHDGADPPAVVAGVSPSVGCGGAGLPAAVAGVSPSVALGAGPLPDVDELIRAYRAFGRRIRLAGTGEVARLAAAGRLVFEGAQGVLLDEWRGFHPHTTWSTTTFANATDLLAEAGADAGDVCRLGVTRTYATRHGAGPFPSEDPSLAPLLPEPHNGTGRWQGGFRVGHLDLVLLRYALEVCGGADALAITHLDTAAAAGDRLRVATAWRAGGTRITRLRPGPFADLTHQRHLTDLALAATPELAAPGRPWPELLADELGVPVAVTSWGPRSGDKHPPTMDASPTREDQDRVPVS
ncbi:adenylosuccinate synthase [Catenuloplanes nepalensis]|uniref:Adenylosuccinate synthetase n=1 Tax=Catenuloplanes nepalensis TaxID=587533 RepID=A0ABT9MJT6_9ACTN|nr:adenylosuccinate synthetase [Catenuloplanes nepalensis]MDP9791680.1 adenylosuccinate synthase [Catenuloplanes nepalensis]